MVNRSVGIRHLLLVLVIGFFPVEVRAIDPFSDCGSEIHALSLDSQIREAAAEFPWARVNWVKLSRYLDPAFIDLDGEVLPHALELYEISGVDRHNAMDVMRFQDSLRLLIHWAGLIAGRAEFEDRSFLPEAALAPVQGIEFLTDSREDLVSSPVTRAGIFYWLVHRVLLHFHPDPATAGDFLLGAPSLKVEKDQQVVRKWSYWLLHSPLEFFARLRHLKWKKLVRHPLRTMSWEVQRVRYGLGYWFTRVFMNANPVTPSLARDLSDQLAVAQNNRTVNGSALEVEKFSQLPAKYQAVAVEEMRNAITILNWTERPQNFDPGVVSPAVKEEVVETAERVIPVARTLAGTLKPEIHRAYQAGLKEGVRRWTQSLTESRAALRHLLYTDLESAHQKVIQAEEDIRKVDKDLDGYLSTVEIKEQERRDRKKALREQWRSQREENFGVRATQFARSFLRARVVANLLQMRIEPVYENYYYSDPQIQMLGMRLLHQAEVAESRKSPEQRKVEQLDLAAQMTRTGATELVKSLNMPQRDLAMNILNQAGAVGAFQILARYPMLQRASQYLVVLSLVAAMAMPVAGPYIFNSSPKEPEIFKVTSSTENLDNLVRYENEQFKFLQDVGERGLTSSEINSILNFLERVDSLPGYPELENQLRSIRDERYFDKISLRYDSFLPGSFVKSNWVDLSPRLTTVMNAMRVHRQIEREKMKQANQAAGLK